MIKLKVTLIDKGYKLDKNLTEMGIQRQLKYITETGIYKRSGYIKEMSI